MGTPASPAVWSIPVWRPFGDALVSGLLERTGGDRMALARGLLILPNHRAVRAIRDAFVRAAEPALLLPRMVTVGDSDLAEAAGLLFDGADAEPIPPAIDPLHRRMLLARMIGQTRLFGIERIDAALAFRLAGDLAGLLDQLTIEKKTPDDLEDLREKGELSEHWQRNAELVDMVRRLYPEELARLGLIDLTDRRNRLLEATARRWEKTPPPGFVVAAGISTAAPAIAGLLRVVARLPQGDVVLAGVDLSMPEEQWQAVRGAEDKPGEEPHPQHHLSVLLDRMGVSVREVRAWPGKDEGPKGRAQIVAKAMAPADYTDDWYEKGAKQKPLEGVAVHRFATPADEAQGIAIALRAALEEPERTAALITPDRALAVRVSGHLKRWGIQADDSAGRPLSQTLAGSLIEALARATADRFAPPALLAVLKHPLVRAGEGRRAWLDGVRWLDAALRGPRPAAGLSGITARLEGLRARERKTHGRAVDWWRENKAVLSDFAQATDRATLTPAAALAAIREAATHLGGDAVWSGQDGRAVADLIGRFESLCPVGPDHLPHYALPQLIHTLLDSETVRPAWGGHHRLFIWGLLEARLQSADTVILGGLNEGSWPQLPAPDPFLAPRLRRLLGLPGLDYRIGLSAHDFTLALGAKQVIITRAARDATAPTIESRFLLRLSALALLEGGAMPLGAWARMIDAAGPVERTPRPAPAPPASERPRRIAVTEADKLVQDPYAYYAAAMLKLKPLDALDGDLTPAWRGSMIHGVLEAWGKVDGYAPGCLIPRIEAELTRPEVDPAIRAFGLPRLKEALGWIERQVQAKKAEGRIPIYAEEIEEIELGDVMLRGKPDRIDRLADGSLAIVDYKSGANPRKKQVQAGFALQLGLLGVMAECGAFKGVTGEAQAFEYWRLVKDKGEFGKIEAMDTAKEDARSLSEFCHERFEQAVADYLTGDAPFTARLNPDYAGFTDYDQLMRLEEWYGPQG